MARDGGKHEMGVASTSGGAQRVRGTAYRRCWEIFEQTPSPVTSPLPLPEPSTLKYNTGG